jgi:predicted alpha/beta hydrolase
VPNAVRITAADGFQVAATQYTPDEKPKAVVVINAATAVKRRYYDRFAQYLAAHGFAVLTYDYRGVGDSAPPKLRGFHATMQQWGELDQPAVLAHARAWQPNVPLMLVGHSVGGQIFGLLRDPHVVTRVLTVAAQHNYWRLWGSPERYGLWALWTLFMPVTSYALGYFPSMAVGLGENLPRGVALDWARWCRSPGALVQAVGGDAAERFTRYRGPMLALSFSDDTKFGPRRAVNALLDFYTNARRQHCHLTPRDLGVGEIGHFGYFREASRALGWPIALDWLGMAAS